MRVLDWIVRRSFGEIDAAESPIGWLPKPEDISLEGLDNVSFDTLKELLSMNKDLWREETKGIHEFYSNFGDKLPVKLKEELAALERNLS